MRDLDDAVSAWMQSERVSGAAFSHLELVQIVDGEHAGVRGQVVSLTGIEPEVRYRVIIASGAERDLPQSSLLSAHAFAEMRALVELQRWYAAQCDGLWEHSYGVKIDTLDNPGWTLRVDLRGTPLQEQVFVALSDGMEGEEWISCRVKDGQFEGAGGPHMLSRLARIFVDWARTRGGSA
jgi:Immunity protein 53